MTHQPASLVFTPRILLADMAVLGAVCGIPALAHLVPFPLYYLDPMRLLLLVSYLFTRNQGNSLLLSVGIPIFSTLVTGHPTVAKALLIAVELLVNISILPMVLERWKLPVLLTVFGSIVVSKCAYYIAKALFMRCGLLDGKLIATDLYAQVLTAGAISCAFALLYRRKS
jgi:hypothetical protein